MPLPAPTNAPSGNNTLSITTPADHMSAATGPESNTAEHGPVREAPEIAQAIKKSFLGAVEPLTGAAIVTCSNPMNFAATQAATASSILDDGVIADFPVAPVSTITFLSASSLQKAKPVTAYAAKAIRAKKLLIKHIDRCTRLHILAPEGAHIAIANLEPGKCIFAQVEYKDFMRDDVIAALAPLNAEAKKLGALIVIFILHTRKQDVTWLREHCQVFVEAAKCEPGPRAQIALVLTNVTLADWHPQGIGRVMVEGFLDPDGAYTYRSEPFVADRAIIRLAWYVLRHAHLHKEEVSLAKIGQVIGIAPSNISRGVAPPMISPKNAVGVSPPMGWHDRWAIDYNLDILWTRKPAGTDVVAGSADKTKELAPSVPQDLGHVAKEVATSDDGHSAPPPKPLQTNASIAPSGNNIPKSAKTAGQHCQQLAKSAGANADSPDVSIPSNKRPNRCA
ncbi:hypothetical protein ACT2FY_05450 [Paraburkholderia fungorum]|uniref:hypothetical protein n=1 Tax=Paraburkholderia fungorum TaxID=134537 RepID=UPI00402B4D03